MTFADLIYKACAWIYNNKQSVLSTVTAALAFVQANSRLRSLMSTEIYEWTMFGVGLLMLLFSRASTGGVVSKVIPASVPAERVPPTEGGFIRPLVLAILLGVGVISVTTFYGCETLGVAQPQTLTERLAAGELAVNGAVASATTLVAAGKLSARDAKAFRGLAVEAHELLGVAEAALEAGDPAEAEARLVVAETVLKTVRAFLVAREG